MLYPEAYRLEIRRKTSYGDLLKCSWSLHTGIFFVCKLNIYSFIGKLYYLLVQLKSYYTRVILVIYMVTIPSRNATYLAVSVCPVHSLNHTTTREHVSDFGAYFLLLVEL